MARNEHVLQFTHGYNRVSKSTSPAFTLHKIDGKQSTTADELEMMPLTNIVGSEPASAKVRYIRTSQPMCCNFCGVIVVCVMVIIIGSGSIPAILQHIRSAGIGQQEMDYLRRGPLGFGHSIAPSVDLRTERPIPTVTPDTESSTTNNSTTIAPSKPGDKSLAVMGSSTNGASSLWNPSQVASRTTETSMITKVSTTKSARMTEQKSASDTEPASEQRSATGLVQSIEN